MGKKIFPSSCFLFLFVFFQVVSSHAELLPLNVQWSYSGSAASYILYKDGVQACVSPDPTAGQMTCNVFIEEVPMIFTMTAVGVDGVESPHSAPYTLNPPVKDAYGNYIPQPSIIVDTTTGDAPLLVSFDASESVDISGTIVSYAWDFGDGEVGNGQLAMHSFTMPGSYTVTLTVMDDGGATAEATVTIVTTDPAGEPIPNQPPTAVVTATPIPDFTSRIGFDAYSSVDADGTIVSYAWDFGDGDTAVGEYVEHEFLAVGDYVVVLTVVDNDGASSQDQITISVIEPPLANTPPVGAISASTTQHMLHFDWGYSAVPELAGFNLYQNGIQICNVPDPTARQADCLAYVDSGLVELWVTSYDISGIESVPSEIFIFDSSSLLPGGVVGDAPLSVFFSSGGTFDADGTIVSYAWDFGDGTVASGPTVEHKFDLPGVYTVTLVVTDDAGDSAQAETSITVTGIVNLPPVVSGGTFITDENKSITGTLFASDPEGDPLSFTLTGNGSLGTATITNSSTGVFTYVPRTDVSGSDAFSFKVNDGLQDSQAAEVTVTIVNVNTPPIAQPITVSGQEDVTFTGSLIATDSDGDQLTYAIVSNGKLGTAVLDAATGNFSYTPDTNMNGTDTFSFKANDGTVDSAVVEVTVMISPVNDSPVAGEDSVVTDEDIAAVIDLALNDSDVDGDLLTYSIDTLPVSGSVVLVGTSVTYTPAANFSGNETFSYRVADSAGASAVGQVNIDVRPVNDPPQAVISSSSLVTTGERLVHVEWEYPQEITLAGFRLYLDGRLSCETLDPTVRSLDCQITTDKVALQLSLTAFDINNVETAPIILDVPVGAILQPDVTQGLVPLALTFDAFGSQDIDGAIVGYEWDFGDGVSATGQRVEHVYTAAGNFAVVLTVTDDLGASVVAEQAITVIAPNNSPAASSVSFTLLEDAVLNGSFSASDVDGDSLSYSIRQTPVNGSVVVPDSALAGFVYTPKADFNGTDSFTYIVNDGQVDSLAATVNITVSPVNDAPVAQADIASTEEDVPVTITVLGNDSDVEGDVLSLGNLSLPANGSVLLSGANVIYTPGANFNGTDSFTYDVYDSKGGQAQSSVTVSILPVNDRPSASTVSVTTDEDTPVIGQLLAADVDNDALTYSLVSTPGNGQVVLSSASKPEFIYSPNKDFNGTDSFTYIVNDGRVDSLAGTVNITVAPVNDSPVAQADTVTTNEDTPVTINALANDSDVDSDPLSFVAVSAGANGVVSLVGSDILLYTPNADFNGTDSFSYIVGDSQGGSANTTVSVTVNSVNDLPVLQTMSQSVTSGVLAKIDVLSKASDVDGDPLVLLSVTASSNAVATINSGLIDYTAKAGFWGDDRLAYAVSDGRGGVVNGVVTITVEQPMVKIAYVWDFDPNVLISVFNFYRNGVKICETKDVALREFTCTAPVVEGVQSFAVTALDPTGIESVLSNVVSDGAANQQVPVDQTVALPTPEQSVTYSWTYVGDTTSLAGFKLYMNGTAICETTNPATRSLNCTIPQTPESKLFEVTSVDKNGIESAFSNSIKY